jgi:hypothetical protein
VVARFACGPRYGFRFLSAASLFENETLRALACRARATDKKEIAGGEK